MVVAERILIVDDDPDQRSVLAQQIQRMGFTALTAEDGDRAVAMLDSSDGAPIDCVILDLVMPGLDGLGVLAHLRRSHLAVPVIVQTGHGGIDNAVSAMRTGAVDFLVKPIPTERLEAALHKALAVVSNRRRKTNSQDDPSRRRAELPDAAPADITIVPVAGAARAHDTLSLLDETGHVRPLEDIEADVIRFAIAHYGGQMSEVARRLRIGRSTLYRRLDARAGS